MLEPRNYSTPAFHNLVSRQPPLNEKDVSDIDALARKRCQTLLSVDDSYVAIHAAVAELGPVPPFSASRSVRRALLTSKVKPGSLYRCGRST